MGAARRHLRHLPHGPHVGEPVQRHGDAAAATDLALGTPSPLREYARLAPTRAAVVKAFAQGLADRHGVMVWAWNSPYSGHWELDWERAGDGCLCGRHEMSSALTGKVDRVPEGQSYL